MAPAVESRPEDPAAPMPQVIVTPQATSGIERCYLYLYERAPDAADRALEAIDEALARLETFPHTGRPYAKDRSLRELVIRFGRRGAYLALFRYEPELDVVRVLAFKHGREEDYKS